MDQFHTYDLAFVTPRRHPRTVPELVFIIDEVHLPEAIDRLHKITNQLTEYARKYLGKDDTTFTLPIPDLFGNKEFGYGKCGYWSLENNKIHLRLQLRPYPSTHYCSLTIFMLTRAFGFPFEDGARSNRQQDVELMTMSEVGRSGGYGHAVGGWISEDVLKWLEVYTRDKVRSLGIIEAAPMHPEVLQAQQAAWSAISSPKMQQYASSRNIYGWVRGNGSFSLNCFGDACDLSIYPDHWLGEGCGSVQFGCHNLDSADQQLTLLVGLAKICQLAREST
jgi:hypothetical protein